MRRPATLSALLLALSSTSLTSILAQTPYCSDVTDTSGRRRSWTSGDRDAGAEAYYELRTTRIRSDCLAPTPYGVFPVERSLRARARAGVEVDLLGKTFNILRVTAEAYAEDNASHVEAELDLLNVFFVPAPTSYSWSHEGYLDFRRSMPVLLMGIAGGVQFGPVTVTVSAAATATFTSGLRLGADIDGVFVRGDMGARVQGNASASLSILGIVGVSLNSILRLLDSQLVGEVTVTWQGNLVGSANVSFRAVAFRMDLCGWFIGFSGCINLVNASTPLRNYQVYP